MKAFDTETELFGPGCMVPPLVCLTVPGELYLAGGPQLRPMVEGLLSEGCTGANTPYDTAQICQEFPDLIPSVWDAYTRARVTDIQTREKLIDIGKGQYTRVRHMYPKNTPGAYSLARIYERRCGGVLAKGEVRTSFRRGTALSEEQRRYAILDADATQEVQDLQESDSVYLVDQYRQVRARWFLFLMSAWGLVTDPGATRVFAANVERRWQDLRLMCERSGMVRPDGSRDTKVSKDRMLGAARELGFDFKLTDTGEAQRRLAKTGAAKCTTCKGKGVLPKTRGGSQCSMCGGSGKSALFSPDAWVCLDEEACRDSGDTYHCADGTPYPLYSDLDAPTPDDVGEPVPGNGEVYGGLVQYAEYSALVKVRSTDVPTLLQPIVHTRFEELQDTGRTGSSKPNIQNLPRAPGVRECLVARPGTVFVDCDYDIVELRTFAQICLWVVGSSILAQKLNADYDPHMYMGAAMLGLTDAQVCCHKAECECSAAAKVRRHAKDAKRARQYAKPINFGIPGGMGVDGLRRYAKSSYGVSFTVEEATRYRELFLNTWPEAREYFKRIRKDLSWGYDGREVRERGDQARERTTIEHFVSGRLRGNVTYTVAANSYFQGLAADLAKAAGFRIARECYDPSQESVLFGCRPVNFIHDQFLVEAPEHIGHEAALRVAWIMCDESRNWIPDVPATVQPALCRRYSKGTESMYVNGLLVPWGEA